MNPFEGFDLPYESGESFSNAPMAWLKGVLSRKYHSRARGNKLMSVEITSPDFQKLMKKLGKKSRGRPSSKPVDFVIYNTASRPPTEKEEEQGFSDIFYAKFWEYGYTAQSGRWVQGYRIFARTRDILKKMIIEEYRQMPSKYTRQDVHDAFERAVDRYINQIIIPMTPVDSGLSKDSWHSKSRDELGE